MLGEPVTFVGIDNMRDEDRCEDEDGGGGNGKYVIADEDPGYTYDHWCEDLKNPSYMEPGDPFTGERDPFPCFPDPKLFVGYRVAKLFLVDGVPTIFFGTVVKYSRPYWDVVYDDGDEEQYDVPDMDAGFALYRENYLSDVFEYRFTSKGMALVLVRK